VFTFEEVYLEDRSLFAYFCLIGYRNNRPEYIQKIADRSLLAEDNTLPLAAIKFAELLKTRQGQCLLSKDSNKLVHTQELKKQSWEFPRSSKML
jgi:hypothetical protein